MTRLSFFLFVWWLFPGSLPEGTHTVTMWTTDMFEQTWTGHGIFRIRSGEPMLKTE